MLTLQSVKCNMNMKWGGNGEGFCFIQYQVVCGRVLGTTLRDFELFSYRKIGFF